MFIDGELLRTNEYLNNWKVVNNIWANGFTVNNKRPIKIRTIHILLIASRA